MTSNRRAAERRNPLATAAADIAHQVHGLASYARDGGMYWCQPSASGEAGGPPRQLDSYLYPGAMGIALFFAFAAKVLGLPEYRTLALRAVAPLRRDLAAIVSDPGRGRILRRRIGGFAGLGSMVYGLVRLGEALKRPGLWQEAADLAILLTPERIGDDDRYEVMTGAAGAVLALLALDARCPGPTRAGSTPLEMALVGAEHLVRNRELWSRHTAAGAESPLGFCHGTAGILTAFARLAVRCDRADLALVAAEEWAGLEAAYAPGSRNWRLRDHGGESVGLSWCNGAAGIVLGAIEARSAAVRVADAVLAGAVGTLELAPLGIKDHLCCGNLGRVDVLIQVARASQERRLLGAAESLAMQVVTRAREEGCYRLMFYPDGVTDVRLFPGLAGIGYALLRVLAPRSVPCLPALG